MAIFCAAFYDRRRKICAAKKKKETRKGKARRKEYYDTLDHLGDFPETIACEVVELYYCYFLTVGLHTLAAGGGEFAPSNCRQLPG